MARRCITDERLPVWLTRTVEANYGSNATCRLCEQSITPQQVEYEVRSVDHVVSLLFHLACHAAWQLECVGYAASSPIERHPARTVT
jgi:hypothetical protein